MTINEIAHAGSAEEDPLPERHRLLWLPVPQVLPLGQQPLPSAQAKSPEGHRGGEGGKIRHRSAWLPVPQVVPVGQHPLPSAHA
jgi:hypothetical protein